MTDSSNSNTIVEKRLYTRIGTPGLRSARNIPSGSYMRLGEYVDDESKFVPDNFLTTDSGETNTPSTANASGLFLKTDGILFLAVESGAYQTFDDVLSVHAKKELTLKSENPASLTGSDVTIESSDGDISVTSSKEVFIEANNGSVNISSTGNNSSKILGDKWVECKGTWKSLAYGYTFSAYLGVSVGLFAGAVVNTYGGIFLTTVAILFARITVGAELVMFGFYRLAAGRLSALKTTINLVSTHVDIKNGDVAIHKNTLWYKKDEIAVEDNIIEVDNNESSIESNKYKLSASGLDIRL